jgi:hypothetical protein
MDYTFVPDYTVEAEDEDTAFAAFMDAIEKDVAHYRRHGYTQIEYRTLAEILGEES